MSADRPATVWASTFVPGKSPIPGYGQDGYSVAWVDTSDGRLQVLVSGRRPAPGTVGRIVEKTWEDNIIVLFKAQSE
ncbi:hypothetical protein [Mycobacterium sp. E796]|uniref:hypothetical protein n=1 Tax=Mycobacterium sp. E796 TaxID=1834151 RepID=UPI00080078A2|nr:hypothetical protein [Mycobacterium sp. E796]OBI67222.1 hypothetical protein A5706_13055 [Mycobacterium sp. E796]